ncbi:AAA family ATPase [Spirochaeta thermophila]|uniref:DRTGG domain-containing protein n=1 Tax=Winmispira thermophila (strain ATCC 49972 / DSM 6192 / RI 19.B1) TaxID=665571 RepID=E0RSA1_WINT6|nr:AAA family ATPase [Spirochaeta thermophila]ADN01888.1 hypothetical protein STHERM_c09410 [Spirochaeta thermophila DSM 6192]
MKRPKVIYITGFRQHAGKTITALGLIGLLQKKYPPEELGYMKPVGQELVPLEDGTMIDKDARILQEFSGIPDLDPRVVSPVRLGSGFTKEFLDSPNRKAEEEKLTRKVLDSMEALSHKKIIVAEGTGHPGVGGIVGLSNARVAEILGAEVVFLSGGGIGKALDMLEVDLHYFMCQGVNVRGVIFNKLIPSKIDQVRHYITEELLQERFPFFTPPIRILGFLPMVEDLSRPTMHLLSTIFPGTLAIGDVNREECTGRAGRSSSSPRTRTTSTRTTTSRTGRSISSAQVPRTGWPSSWRHTERLENRSEDSSSPAGTPHLSRTGPSSPWSRNTSPPSTCR